MNEDFSRGKYGVRLLRFITMGRERKCILCHIIYNSKKEMSEHMRSMLHHRELENLKGRDSNHECRVCRVTVVGLSAYAKHISSQLHKDNADAYDRVQEEGKEEADEEYFDKELIQLINQRKQQSWQEEAGRTNNETESQGKRLKNRMEDRSTYLDRGSYDQSSWHHHGPPQREWKWEKEGFNIYRQGNFPQSAGLPSPSGHLNGPKGQTGWHLNGPGCSANQLKTHSNAGGIWHSNGGGSSSWHQGGTGRNPNWHLEGPGVFPTWQSSNCGKSWNLNSNSHGRNGWNFDGSSNGFSLGRNRVLNPLFSEGKAFGWKNINRNPNNNNLKGYAWEWQGNSSTCPVPPYRDLALDQSKKTPWSVGFTRDKFPPTGVHDFQMPQKLDNKISKCSGKSSSPSRDKYRWTPYPFQRTAESQSGAKEIVPQGSEKDVSSADLQSLLAKADDQKPDNTAVFPKQTSRDNHISASVDASSNPDFSTSDTVASNCSTEQKPDQDASKINKMPSLKSNLLSISNIKSFASKQDPKNLLKSVKLFSSSSSGADQINLNALDLDTKQSSSYNDKLHSPHFQTLKEPVESLTEVLKKAKEMLQCSQHLHSQHLNSHANKKLLQRDSSMDEQLIDSTKDNEQKMNTFENVSESELARYENSGAVAENLGPHNNEYLASKSPHSEHSMKNDEHMTGALGQVPNISDIVLSLQKSSTASLAETKSKASQEEGNEDSLSLQANLEAVVFENGGSDHELQKESSQSSASRLLELGKLRLPASLQRDLTRHIGSKSKAGAHLPEPNLNIARRIRNVNCYRKNEMDKESGLKPTLRQILNASRRNVNWEQVIQQVTKKKQELGKGLPRFGIEMIAPVHNDQEELDLNEEPDLSSLEGFHWEGISVLPPGSIRKRSLSESSVAVDRSASVYDFFDDQITKQESEKRQTVPTSHLAGVQLKPNCSSEVGGLEQEETTVPESSSAAVEKYELITNQWQHSTHSSRDTAAVNSVKKEENLQSYEQLDKHSSPESQGDRCGLDQSGTSAPTSSAVVEAATDSSCTSGTEQNDAQGIGKKRRATADRGSPEIPSLERKNKRRKLKSKKERSQVDQLLSISLREEELTKSLQGVDSNVLQARATLQAAYVEVQSLLVLKQQITVEMNTLRTQRIQILQGLQDTILKETHEPPDCAGQPSGSTSGEKRNSKLQEAVDLSSGHLFSLLEAPLHQSPFMSSSTMLRNPLQVSTLPAFPTAGNVSITMPDSSVTIKQEPISLEHGNESMNTAPYSSTCASSAVSLYANELSQSPLLYPVITATRSLTELVQSFSLVSSKSAPDGGMPKSSESNSPSHSHFSSKKEENRTLKQSALSEGHSSSFQTHVFTMQARLEKYPCPPSEQPEQHAESTFASTESQGGKKKKKLRKKKSLRAAHVPENSDTEHDTDAGKPTRKIKSKRIPKEIKVTTSSLLDGGTMQETENKDENDSDSSVEVVDISNTQFEVVAIDSEYGDEKPDSPSKQDFMNNTELALVETMNNCSYDEVTSTSEMGSNYKDGVHTSVAGTQTPLSSIKGTKTSSEVSSEPGEDEDPTEGNFEGHQAAVNAIQIFGSLLYTCSADKTVRAYNLVNRKCVGTFEGHTSKVNCLLVIQTHGKQAVLYTGSSDHTIRCYNIKTRKSMEKLELADRVLCLHSRWRILYTGLANGSVVTFNIKNNKQLDVFECHGPRAISCLATAQEGARRLLVVGSYDCTISVRDARNGLLLRTLEGHSKTVLCMKVVNDLVFSGSSDQSVHAHNIHTGELVRIYKGHSHAVTVVNILGKVMVTACLDKFVRVYELQSHDRLQVYGGHHDMIMCMAIHKSMIYTGCYDGSVQAVRLNLVQNFRCWWHGCALIFGVIDHLKQHLINDHTNPNFQSLKCRWKNCDAFFTTRRGSKQDAVSHIEQHAEDDSKLDT
uniref:Zinc finger protein 106 isoform X2 n=1 Tax=Geotrypetes seraphini TaxID=260995 RepID=A0A6P8RMP6_GEOSA|nr:zinc finger protein 106 isoform X2 [Geotrypetes seraphini]